MQDVTKEVKIEIKVHDKNVLAANAPVFYEETREGIVIKTKLGTRQDQAFEMKIHKFTAAEDITKE